MPVSKELRKLLEENKLNKSRPTGTKWTCGKRWDRIQTVKKNLEKLHGENEVQYAVFLTYPNPKGDPSRYLYMEGEEIQKLVQDQMTFTKAFLELEPKWTNPPTFVSTERIDKRKRLRSHGSAESDHSQENDLPATPCEETSIPPASDEETTLAAGSHINHNIVVDTTNQEENASVQNPEKVRLQNPKEPEQTDKISNEKDFLKGLKQELHEEKQKKYRQRTYKPKQRLLPKDKRKQSEDQSSINQETSSKETKRQKNQEDPNAEETVVYNGNSAEETQTVIICINLGEDGTLHLEETDCHGIT